jgi:subtilisin family serine protease
MEREQKASHTLIPNSMTPSWRNPTRPLVRFRILAGCATNAMIVTHSISFMSFARSVQASVSRWFATPLAFTCLAIGLQSSLCTGAAQLLNPNETGASAYRPDRILIQPKARTTRSALTQLHATQQGEVLKSFEGMRRLQIVRVPAGETVESLLAKYRQSGLVEFAEPDYAVHMAATPNDPKFLDGTLWGLHNTGQSGGTADADIDAPEAWDVLTSASNVIVAVLDTGVRYTHEDLAANMWTNPTDGGHGLNAITGTNNPNDDQGHGTLVSGILGAVGNNGKGLAGVAWRVQIMACKCLDSSGNGNDSDVIECIDYARTNGARIITASLDSPSFSQALSNAVLAAREAGILFVASAGNNTANIDLNPRYPASYDIDNIISVAYTTRTDALGSLSNYGATNVDLAAPGAAMYSTFFASDTSYLGAPSIQGTSFAAPYVAGALALMLTKFSSENYQQIIERLLNATDPIPALTGKCATGGRLNVRKALSPPITLALIGSAGGGSFPMRVSGGPNRQIVIEFTTDLTTWTPVFTNTTSAAGTFDFEDVPSASPTQRFYRATAEP